MSNFLNMIMKSLFLILACVFSKHIAAQNSFGKVSGSIADENKMPVEFANVTLHKAGDSLLVKGAISDKNGFFEMENIPIGDYFFRVSNLMFERYNSEKFALTIETNSVHFSDVLLKQGSGSLNEVSVNAEKQFIEKHLDKLVVNVENSIVAAGNTILEVLQRSPGVVVNEGSSISLKGKAGVLVMIDGKPIPLSDTELIAYLKSIPASNVQLIEIISNPSAKYDANGNAGIINIRFKKDKRQGFNGTTTVAYGQGVYPKPSASLTFNLREKKWNFFGSYSYSRPQNFTYFYINRKFFDQTHQVNSIFEQKSYTNQPIDGHNSRIGIDFYPNSKTIIGVLVSSNWSKSNRDGHTDATISNAFNAIDYTTETSILLKDTRFNGFANVNFKHTIDSLGKELTADFDYGTFDSKTAQDITNINSLPNGTALTNSKINTNQVGNITVKSIKADYVHPFSAKTNMEVGLKSSFVTSDNEVQFFNVVNTQSFLDTLRSNHFLYQENINAAYVSLSEVLTKWDFQAGLRMEHTNTKGKQLSTGETFSRNYVNFFPNLLINRKFSEKNSLSISYAKRIDRPTYRQLNPFKIFVDSYTYVVGDPTINPVYNNIFEINHLYKGKYVTTVSYTNSKHSITDIFVQDDATKISYQIPANIQNFEQYNLGIYIPFSVKKVLNATLAASVYRNKYSSPLQGGQLVQNFNSWDMNLNTNFTLGENGWSAELTGSYQSKMVWGLFYIKNLGQISVGIQKTAKNKNSTFKVSMSDIFRTNHIAVIVQYQNQDFFTDRRWDSRVITFSYTYRFGKKTVTKARQRVSGVEDEKRRAG